MWCLYSIKTMWLGIVLKDRDQYVVYPLFFFVLFINILIETRILGEKKSIFFLPCIIKNHKTFWGPLYRSDCASNDCIIQYNWKSLNLMSSIETSTCGVIRCRANFLSSTTKFSKQKIDFNGILCVKVSQKGSSKKRYHRKVIGLILILSIAQRVYKISSGINLFSFARIKKILT